MPKINNIEFPLFYNRIRGIYLFQFYPMSILISGSVAFDTIIQTVGNFRNQDTVTNKDLYLSLFAPIVRRENGWVAANIAYSLALLGKSSHIIASIGEDGTDNIKKLQELGINTELVRVVPWSYSPQAYILRDQDNGQINTFHPGAMDFSGEITHGNIEFKYVIVSPDSKNGMIRRLNECVAAGIFTIFDPGQAMGIFSWEELKRMVIQANITIMNEPEKAQFQEIVWEDFVTISLSYGHTAVVTLWENWSQIYQPDAIITHIAGIYTDKIVDATGCGDSYRAWLLYWLSEWWSIAKSCKLGSIIGGIKIQSIGPQNHTLDKEIINTIGEKQFGEKFFD